MDEFFSRQAAVMRHLMLDYSAGRLDLNTLIQRVEGIADVIGRDVWKDAVFPIVLAMEQINALALNAKTSLTEANKAVIEDSLSDLEVLIERFEKSG